MKTTATRVSPSDRQLEAAGQALYEAMWPPAQRSAWIGLPRASKRQWVEYARAVLQAVESTSP